MTRIKALRHGQGEEGKHQDLGLLEQLNGPMVYGDYFVFAEKSFVVFTDCSLVDMHGAQFRVSHIREACAMFGYGKLEAVV